MPRARAADVEPDDLTVPEVETPPAAPAMPASVGAAEGDRVVYVRLLGSSALTPVLARSAKRRQIMIDGRPCEHVGTADDGTWIYEQRAS